MKVNWYVYYIESLDQFSLFEFDYGDFYLSNSKYIFIGEL